MRIASFHRLVAALIAVFLAGIAITPAAAGQTSKPSVADFVRRPDFTQVQLSPDDKYLAALLPRPNEPHQNQLVLLDAGTAKPLRVLDSGAH
jgi:hypothetical protein